jgi:maltooligosyltrehalose trehalohydrolase
MAPLAPTRRLSAGVEILPDGRVHARVWAPACRRVEFVLEGTREAVALEPEADGFFAAFVTAAAGDRYWLRLDGERLRPDPVSRSQPDGPHGPSAIVDPAAFRWTDGAWRGVAREGQVLYEMHVGTFTPEGTWAAAAEWLAELARIGITVIEMMPVNDFAGRFGWGYDGVDLYAPTRLYGTPDDLRAFVDRAHAVGLGVILDVVYNHVGPDGNYLAEFSPDYFTDAYKNDWGQAINFEGPAPARQFFVENAGYWIEEFHVDGLRLDATQDLHDASPEHVIASVGRRAREAGRGRAIYIVGENEPQDANLVRPLDQGGAGLDALWNDDYHHAAIVALTGRREAYYTDYKGSPGEFVACAKYGFLYQGQWYSWQKQRRGTASLDLPSSALVCYLENHDQVANSAFGRRLHQLASPARFRALTALTLLGPWTPLLFQGQEFAASAPFLYFADHRPDLQPLIRRGRRAFLEQFVSMQDPEVGPALPSPVDETTFQRCQLDQTERTTHAEAYALHADLLRLRRTDPAIARPERVDGAVLSPEAFVLRFFGGPGRDRLLVANLGPQAALSPIPEPLLAPPAGRRWQLAWSSESVKYGGQGTPPLRPHPEWQLAPESAVLFSAEPDDAADACPDGPAAESQDE